MLFKKLLRTIWHYKAQFISMIIMVLLGVGVFVGFQGEWYSIEKDTYSFYDSTGFADYRLISEAGYSLEEMNNGCYQNWCFGPTLLDNGIIAVEEDEEIDGRSKSDNQRTALGYVGTNHFYFLTTEVSGGRNSKSSSSFSLYDLAKFFQELGCTYAYNLDGGGSVSMYADGKYPIEANRKLGDIIYVVNA